MQFLHNKDHIKSITALTHRIPRVDIPRSNDECATAIAIVVFDCEIVVPNCKVDGASPQNGGLSSILTCNMQGCVSYKKLHCESCDVQASCNIRVHQKNKKSVSD